jgi:hypothetical protein
VNVFTVLDYLNDENMKVLLAGLASNRTKPEK